MVHYPTRKICTPCLTHQQININKTTGANSFIFPILSKQRSILCRQKLVPKRILRNTVKALNGYN